MDESQSISAGKKSGKMHNTLPIWGNEASMNLNPLILANIQGSSYFKVHLFKLKTYHEVVDEIYYQVKHMEPWERGSRKTSGQTGMCGGVRGVGAGGIVSTAFCLLYKLYTLRLTRKQVNGLLNHSDSPYIRALGFMYLRYTQPPADLYDWYEDYLQDEEEIDVKAGGGQMLTIGQMVYQFLTKLDWFSTLFPRIPVPIQKQIEKKMEQYCRENGISLHQLSASSNHRAGSGGAKGIAPPLEADGVVKSSYSDDDYDQRRGSGSSRAPQTSNYRSEHDDRDYYRERRRDDYDVQLERERQRIRENERGRDRQRERDRIRDNSRVSERSREVERERSRRDYDLDNPEREQGEKERHKNKHKKKKHKQHRSRSRSHSRNKRERKRDARGNGASLEAERRY